MNAIILSSLTDKVHSLRYTDFTGAKKAFDAAVKAKTPCIMQWESVPCNITIDAYAWNVNRAVTFAEATTRASVQERLVKAGVPSDKVSAIMTMELQSIIAAVIAKDKSAFVALKGVGDKTAEKVISVLHGKVTYGAVVIGNTRKQFHQRPRVTLNRNWMINGDDRPWIFDSVRKRWSNLEAYATAVSGDEFAIINVVSTIPELSAPIWDLAARERAELKQEVWTQVCHKGLTLNGRKYVFIGHGTNAAKENSTLFCLDSCADKVRQHFFHGVNPEWKITDAKKVAYMVGLQAVYTEPIGLPIQPEDFEIFPSLVQEVIDNVAQNHVDGTVTFIENKPVRQNQFDGFSVMSVSAKMQNAMIDRLVAKGCDREKAIRQINHELAVLRGHTFRTWEGAFKGVVYTNFDMHSFLHDRGVHTLHGRDIDDIVLFSDETVLKTPIGEGKAYPSKEAWINAVKENFQYGKLLCEHDLKKKDVPYQVIQTAHKADPGTVRAFAEEQATELNRLHDLDYAKKCLTKEQQALIDFMPEAANTRYFEKRMKAGFYSWLDDAFSGKRIGQCFGALLAPDVVAFAEHIGGLEVKGFLNAGETCCFKLSNGEFAFWRNPVLDPGSLRVLNNVKKVPDHLRKYFHFDTSMMMINIKDTTITRVRGDFDGDKGSFSKNKWLIQMFKECHENFGDWLSDWDEIPGTKGIVTEDTLKDYASGLCRESSLGQTCCGLNKMYAGKRLMKSGEIVHVECSYEEVSNSTTRANNLVDEGKHGKKSYAQMKSVAAKTAKTKEYEPLHPNAKTYRDLREAMAKALADDGPRTELDKIAEASWPRYGSLDIYTGRLSDLVDRTFHIDNLPKGKFDPAELLYDKKLGRRGMSGLIRFGEIYVKELGCNVDEGLVNSIFRRTARDWEIVSSENDNPEKNIAEETFFAQCRVQGLAEIEAFATACGATLKDAFDVVTRWVFCDAPSIYKNDGTPRGLAMETLFDQVNRGYWTIFGGMVEDRIAELRQELGEDFDMNVDVAI